MNVLVLSQFYPPEIGATQTRVHGFASGLAALGHRVTVVCEVPNHPQGVVRPGYRFPLVRRLVDDVHVVHVAVWATPRKSAGTRLAFYASYAATAALAGAALGPFDVIWASSPPLPVGIAAAVLARRHRAPWVLDVRDLWPLAAVAMGELANPRALQAARHMEEWLYRDAAAITAVTRPFARHVSERAPTPVTVLPNGTTEFWFEDGGSFDVPPSRGAPFMWTFAGNVGRAQGLGAAVEAAALLGAGFELTILGDGPDKGRLEALAAQTPGARVRFLPQAEPEFARYLLRASDALLVSLSAAPELAAFVPSKLFDFAATGRPVILAAGGEAARLAQSTGCAYVVAPGSPHRLADAVRRLAGGDELAAQLARAGPAFAATRLRSALVPTLERLLSTVAGRRTERDRVTGPAGSPSRAGTV